jgi:hypothetical protein
MSNSMSSDDTNWPDDNTLVRLADGNIIAATYAGVNEVHRVKCGAVTAEITSHKWQLKDGRVVVCTHPPGDGINRPQEIRLEMA